jgi:hypothetical protein
MKSTKYPSLPYSEELPETSQMDLGGSRFRFLVPGSWLVHPNLRALARFPSPAPNSWCSLSGLSPGSAVKRLFREGFHPAVADGGEDKRNALGTHRHSGKWTSGLFTNQNNAFVLIERHPPTLPLRRIRPLSSSGTEATAATLPGHVEEARLSLRRGCADSRGLSLWTIGWSTILQFDLDLIAILHGMPARTVRY